MRYDFEQYGDKLIHRQRISDSKGKSLGSSTDAKFNGPNNGNAHHREEYFATHANGSVSPTVPSNHLQFGMGVEHAADNHSQHCFML
jgi:hypothetical protein